MGGICRTLAGRAHLLGGSYRPTARQTLTSYYEVAPDVVEDPEELRAWAGEAADAARTT